MESVSLSLRRIARSSDGHDLAEEVEAAIRGPLPRAHVTTHIEPIEDARAHADIGLDRPLP